jgi:hypothetical protein
MNKTQNKILEAQKKILPLVQDLDHYEEGYDEMDKLPFDFIQVGVADGHATYVKWAEHEEWTEFVWFEGGLDGYILNLGGQFMIPTKMADKLITGRKAIKKLFSGEQND